MRLFCDCKTDEEKSNFFLSGRAVETGVIAPAISNDVAMAYHRCTEFQKEIDALRAKIEAMEKQEPVGCVESLFDYFVIIHNNFDRAAPVYLAPGAQPAPSVPEFCPCCGNIMRACMSCPNEDCNAVTVTAEQAKYNKVHALMKTCATRLDEPPAPSAPSEEAAAETGVNGGHVVEAERLAFEAWMRGHCWKLGAKWTGTEYRSAFEKGGTVDMHAMRTRELWAAWRDRAALAAPKPKAKT